MDKRKKLMKIYELLKKEFGKQNWWPAETKFEMMVGAILTQNVSWNNVEIAIDNLKENDILDPFSIQSSSLGEIQKLIKPTGFYKQKSKRLKRLADAVVENDGLEKLLQKDDLREYLLNINGIGPETADSIILYAADRPKFVVDSYTKRIINRVIGYEGNYRRLQQFFESNLRYDLELYKEYHALIVELGKNYCKKEPVCNGCPLIEICKLGKK